MAELRCSRLSCAVAPSCITVQVGLTTTLQTAVRFIVAVGLRLIPRVDMEFVCRISLSVIIAGVTLQSKPGITVGTPEQFTD